MPRTAISFPRQVTRNFGTSLYFDGVDDRVHAITLFTRTAGQPITVGCWIKTSGNQPSGNGGGLISVRNGSGAGQIWRLHINQTGTVKFDYDLTGSGGTAGGTPKYNDGRWHFVVGVYNGTNIILYVDGVQVAISASLPSAAMTTGLCNIGRRPDFDDERYRGLIEEPFVANQALTPTEIADLYYTGVYPSGKITNKWLFNEGSGTTATDSVGSQNGTIAGATYSTDVPMHARSSLSGMLGSALKFDGSTSKVASFNTSFTRTAGQPFAMGGWFKSAGASAASIVCIRNGSSAGQIARLMLSNGTAGRLEFGYDVTGSGATINSVANTYNDDAWHHVVGVYDGTNLKLYIDGALVTTSSSLPNAALGVTNFAIGTRPDFSAEWFTGLIDDVFVCDDSLTAGEVSALYANGMYPKGKLRHRFPLDEPGYAVTTDVVGLLTATVTKCQTVPGHVNRDPLRTPII